MKKEHANIFRAFAVLSAFIAAALAFANFVYWAAGLAGIAALLAVADFAGCCGKFGKDEKR